MSSQGTKAMDLDSMSLEQLNSLKQNEESRLQAITTHWTTLRNSAVRFSSAKEAISSISPAHDLREIMVPLTESLYVPGRIRDPNKVVVDIGTGFYVEKTAKEAQAFLERKLKLVDANSENLMEAITGIRRNIENINIAMQAKLMEIRARQEGVRYRLGHEGQDASPTVLEST
mmetsp:Transcript_19288/g.27137  ORF Transcript_19288/g.27137 Transcript_19288/m.27137 type:complete len:173 (-) Transcript_19288:111-629(-)|eukprot:CAMPEP_0184863366 /NCGR_PEP_ID=MMETSP0580-20130426/10770_1 /TAXON_ID=1118495 /ORGANISM="Dactyliosolen fragilissimus" /LENGTH=172 /DNA_ID=CAMNT_0027361661 /DNA_START=83 /DNA_END=601 /DNA_ORIENTATION=+